MSEPEGKAIELNVRLKASEASAHPLATNYSNVGVASGIAYVDFGFIEPALLVAIAKAAKDGQTTPKGLEGHLVTRVAMGRDVLARLHQQIQLVLVSMRDAQLPKSESQVFYGADYEHCQNHGGIRVWLDVAWEQWLRVVRRNPWRTLRQSHKASGRELYPPSAEGDGLGL